MKVTELKCENFKKLTAVDIILNGKSITVSGQNGCGKSSFIDAVWIALTGKEVPAEPIRIGEKQASIEVTVKDEDGSQFVVEKIFHQKKPTQLVVRQLDEDGRLSAPERSPQGFLDGRLGKISFDPFEFIHKTPKDQKAFLMRLLDLDFSELDKNKARFLEDKKINTNDLKKLEGQLEALPKLQGDYTEEKDLSEIMAYSNKLQAAKDNQTRAHQNVETLARNIFHTQGSINEIEEEIKKLQEKKASFMEVKTKQEADLIAYKEVLAKAEEAVKEASGMDIEAKINEIKQHNDNVRTAKQKVALIADIKKLNLENDMLVKQLEAIEEQRKLVLANSEMPDPKLSFTEDGLLYDGLPFTEEQLSHAKVIEIGIGIQMALNPKLRIMRVKDASMCDSKTLETIKKLAAGKDYQLFIEKVADTEEIGFMIEEEIFTADQANLKSEVAF